MSCFPSLEAIEDGIAALLETSLSEAGTVASVISPERSKAGMVRPPAVAVHYAGGRKVKSDRLIVEKRAVFSVTIWATSMRSDDRGGESGAYEILDQTMDALLGEVPVEGTTPIDYEDDELAELDGEHVTYSLLVSTTYFIPKERT